MLGLHCCLGFSLVAVSGDYSVVVALGFLIAVASLVTEHDSRVPGLRELQLLGSKGAGSVTVACGPSCSAACGIFSDQGLNLCLLHWQVDPSPLNTWETQKHLPEESLLPRSFQI